MACVVTVSGEDREMSIDFGDINYLAVVVAVVVNMAAGALWYSPVLFAKPWSALTGITDEYVREHRRETYRGYAIAVGASIVISLALAVLIQLAGVSTLVDGVMTGLMAGIGFVATTQAATYAFHNRPLKLYLIDVGYPVVAFAILGALLGAWQ